jgi:hypothetical protein
MNTNAKQEFLEHTEGMKVRCAKIRFNDGYYEEDRSTYILPVGYCPSDLKLFLKEIDHNYDSGFGGQELFGTIWYTDGTWSTRGEYDGSEWWEYHTCPEITPDLLGD